MNRAVGAVMLVAAVATLIVGSSTLSAQTPAARINVTGTVVDVRTTGTQPGAMHATVLRLWNRTESGLPIGHAYVVCRFLGLGGLLGGGATACDATFSLPYGKITATGVRHSPRHYTLTLTGGSRSLRARHEGKAGYVGIVGTVNRRAARPGEARFIFVLG